MDDALSWGSIIARILQQFLPVWIALIVTFSLSIRFKRNLGLYGKLFDSPVGMVGFMLVMFWVFTAVFADLIITMDPIAQFGRIKNPLPGTRLLDAAAGQYDYFLLRAPITTRENTSRAR